MGYFRPLRRKSGVITLLMACASAIWWGRSACQYSDYYTLNFGERGQLLVLSDFHQLEFHFTFGRKAHEDDPFVHWHDGGRSVLDRPIQELVKDEYEVIDWTVRGHGFASGVMRNPRELNVFYVLPYWSIVIPLTLLSAWLLLSKRRKPTRPEPSSEQAA